MRTPIKDLRHVSKALPVLKDMIPVGSNVNTFLLFSGDLEINLAEADRNVISHTTEYSVYDFWLTLFEEPDAIIDNIKFFYPFPDQDVFNVFQKTFSEQSSPAMRAALFFLLNRCSDSGMISFGKFDQSNYNPIALSHLKRFRKNNFDVKLDKDFYNSIARTTDTDFIFVPAGKFNYSFFQEGMNTGSEQTRFDHDKLAYLVSRLTKKTIVLYSYHPRVMELYRDQKTKILIDKSGKITKNKDNAVEVLIANY